MKYFGHPFMRFDLGEALVPAPVGVPCAHCQEPIIAGDSGWILGNYVFHHDCHMRGIVGSVAHQEKRCSCYVPGSTEDDPPGMTRRRAAQAAVALWQSSHENH